MSGAPEDRGGAPDPHDARVAYQDYAVGESYEQVRFSGLGGRYRRRRELTAVSAALERVAEGVTMLDCPCGTGRWWPTLGQKASRIVAVDISEGMLRHARERAQGEPGVGVAEVEDVEVEVMGGDAESLPLEDDSVDWAFSFALTKHLPAAAQGRVLVELSRVSRHGVISTFGLLTPVSRRVWNRRGLEGSYPLEREELEGFAADAGLRIEGIWRPTTPVGTERLVLLLPGGTG